MSREAEALALLERWINEGLSPTLVWEKARRIVNDEPKRSVSHVTVAGIHCSILREDGQAIRIESDRDKVLEWLAGNDDQGPTKKKPTLADEWYDNMSKLRDFLQATKPAAEPDAKKESDDNRRHLISDAERAKRIIRDLEHFGIYAAALWTDVLFQDKLANVFNLAGSDGE